MTTSEFCRQMHTTRDTLRYYEQAQLLVAKRGQNHYRQYTLADQQTFQIIKNLQQAGLSLNEITLILKLRTTPVTPACHDATNKFINEQALKFTAQAKLFQQLAQTATQLAAALQSNDSTTFTSLLERLGVHDD